MFQISSKLFHASIYLLVLKLMCPQVARNLFKRSLWNGSSYKGSTLFVCSSCTADGWVVTMAYNSEELQDAPKSDPYCVSLSEMK